MILSHFMMHFVEVRFSALGLRMYLSSKIFLMVNKILNFLRNSIRGGSISCFDPIKNLHSPMNFTEEEVDEFFKIFILKGNFDGELEEEYWVYLKIMKQKISSCQFCGKKTLLFYMEVRRNKILKKNFLSIPLQKINAMSKRITNAIESPNLALEYPNLIEQHRKMNITEEELNEFSKLYFKVCSPEVDSR